MGKMRPPSYYNTATGVGVIVAGLVDDERDIDDVMVAESVVSGYDSDEPPESIILEDDKLLWRQDPKRSCSDWKFVVSYEVAENRSPSSPPDSPVSTMSSSSSDRDDGSSSRTKSKHKTDIYHVHQLILSTRSRKSDYFAKLFSREGDDSNKKKNNHVVMGGSIKSSKSSKTSYITLPTEQAAKVLPIVLDYIYSIDAPLEYILGPLKDPELCTALYYISGLLDIRRLRWESKQYWLTDVRSETCPIYYNLSKVYQEDKITHAIIIWCASNILEMDELTAPDTTTSSVKNVHGGDEFWKEVVQCHYSMKEEQQQQQHQQNSKKKIQGDGAADDERDNDEVNVEQADEDEAIQVSLHLSQLLYCHFGSTIDIIDERRTEAFQFLTQSKYLPIIHRDVAISMLDLERTIVGNIHHQQQQQVGGSDSGREQNSDTENPASSLVTTLTDLQKRCIQSLTNNWKKIGGMDISELTLLQRQSPIILTELLIQVAQIGHTEIQETKEELASCKMELTNLNKELKKERHKTMYKKQVVSHGDNNNNTTITTSMSNLSLGEENGSPSHEATSSGGSTGSPTSVVGGGYPPHPYSGPNRSYSFNTPPRNGSDGTSKMMRAIFRNQKHHQTE